MSSIDLLQPATALSASLASGLFNATELLDQSLNRVDKLNPTLNAIVSFDLTRARAAATASDERRAAGRALGPLDGLPITIKDSISTAGHVTTSGFPPFANHVPAEDAIVVGRLRAAGAVIFGKTNLPPLAGDLQTENTLFGRTANPWDTTRGPGGSSGGSAAAVSTGMSALDIGSDIGGSIRNPAHYCGIYGHKPTFEVYPQKGHIPPPPGYEAVVDMGTLGPLARSAADLRLIFHALVTPTTAERRLWSPQLLGAEDVAIRGMRVVIWDNDPLMPVDSETRAQILALGDRLELAGAVVDRTARPAFDLAEAIASYIMLIAPLFGATFSDADIAAFSDRAESLPPQAAKYLKSIAAGRSRSLSEFMGAKEVQARNQAAWADFFLSQDFLICPVAPTAAFVHQVEPMSFARTVDYDGQTHPYWDQFLWCGALANFAHLPGTARPLALTATGLPMGVQVIGPTMGDFRTIAFAAALDVLIPSIPPPQIAMS